MKVLRITFYDLRNTLNPAPNMQYPKT